MQLVIPIRYMKQAGVSCLGIASGIVYHENLEDAAASGLLWN